jgi:hypothetical protein
MPGRLIRIAGTPLCQETNDVNSRSKKLIRRQGRNGSSVPALASSNSTTFLYAEDLEEIRRMVSARGKTESEVLRDVVHEWVRLKKKKILAAEAAAVPEQVGSVVEEAVARQLAPLRERQAAVADGISKLLSALAGAEEDFRAEKATGDGAGRSPVPGELTSLLRRLETELVATRQYVAAERAESGERLDKQTRQLARLLERSRAQYTILGQSFMCGWTTLEFVVSLLVATRLRLEGLEPEEVASKTVEERVRLRERGHEMISVLENELKLSNELRLELIHNLLP